MKKCSILIDGVWFEIEYTQIFAGEHYHKIFNASGLVALVPVTMLIVSGVLDEEDQV